METIILRCKLLAKKNELMGYQILVFENLEENPPFGHKYAMVTVFPNWQSEIPDLGDVGFLTYSIAIGGEDTYYDKRLDSNEKYKNTQVFFEKFVKEKLDTQSNIYL